MVNLLVFSKSTWKPFKDRFSQSMVAFREHRKIIDREANLSHMLEAKRARELDLAARLVAIAQKRGK